MAKCPFGHTDIFRSNIKVQKSRIVTLHSNSHYSDYKIREILRFLFFTFICVVCRMAIIGPDRAKVLLLVWPPQWHGHTNTVIGMAGGHTNALYSATSMLRIEHRRISKFDTDLPTSILRRSITTYWVSDGRV